ncbi:MAG: signal peptidase II, partial [Actinomycetota bacterium]|nr:signal peptidase II [Actinomycetota bacterium]
VLRPWVRPERWGCASVQAAADCLDAIYAEGQRRAEVLDRAGVVKRTLLPAGEQFPPLIVIVDELTSMVTPAPATKGLPPDRLEAAQGMNAAKAIVLDDIARIAREYRWVGIHLLVGTQSFATALIGTGAGELRQNLGTRVLLGRAPVEQRGMIFSDAKAAEPAYLAAHGLASGADEDAQSDRAPVRKPGRGCAEIEGAPTPGTAFQGFFASESEMVQELTERGVPTWAERVERDPSLASPAPRPTVAAPPRNVDPSVARFLAGPRRHQDFRPARDDALRRLARRGGNTMTALLDAEPVEADTVAEPAPLDAPRSRWTQRWVLLLIAVIVIAADQCSKWWAWRHAATVHVNAGASSGWPSWIGNLYLGPATGAAADVVGVLVLVAVARWLMHRRRPWVFLVGAGLVLAGEGSNVLDRTVTHWWLAPGQPRGAVDWFAFGPVHTGNVADVATIIGWAILLVAAVIWAARRWRGRTVAALVLVGLVVAGAVGTARADRAAEADTLPPASPAGTVFDRTSQRLPAPAPGMTLTEDTLSISRGPLVPGPSVTASFDVGEANGLRARVPARFVRAILDPPGHGPPTYVFEAAVARVPIDDGAGTMWVVVPMGPPSTAEPVLVQATPNIVVYLPRPPTSGAAMTTSKSEAVEAVAWAAEGWGSTEE